MFLISTILFLRGVNISLSPAVTINMTHGTIENQGKSLSGGLERKFLVRCGILGKRVNYSKLHIFNVSKGEAIDKNHKVD